MKSRATYTIAATLSLSLLLSTASTALAGPVQINKVQQVIKGSAETGWQDGSSELRRNEPQKTNDPVKTENNDPNKTGNTTQQTQQDPTQAPVRTEVVEEFVEEGACNCPTEPGVIDVPKGGFPWWVLGGGAVPLAFIKKGEDTPPDNPPSTPTPTPPPNPVPEPATLFLFGSGLLALGIGARRKFLSADDNPTIGEG